MPISTVFFLENYFCVDKKLTAFWVSLRRFHSSPINLERSGKDSSAQRYILLPMSRSEVKLTGMFGPKSWASVIIVEHVGWEGSLELIPVGVLHHFLFCLLFLLFFGLSFARAAHGSSSRCHPWLLLLQSLIFVSGARLRLFYNK